MIESVRAMLYLYGMWSYIVYALVLLFNFALSLFLFFDFSQPLYIAQIPHLVGLSGVYTILILPHTPSVSTDWTSLPIYKSYEQLREKITLAIQETEGFGQE